VGCSGLDEDRSGRSTWAPNSQCQSWTGQVQVTYVPSLSSHEAALYAHALNEGHDRFHRFQLKINLNPFQVSSRPCILTRLHFLPSAHIETLLQHCEYPRRAWPHQLRAGSGIQVETDSVGQHIFRRLTLGVSSLHSHLTVHVTSKWLAQLSVSICPRLQ
jgi:hypothetical protein